VVASGGNRIDLFAHGGDGAMWHRRWGPATDWQAWDGFGGRIVGGPDASSTVNPGYTYVIARGTDDAVWYQYSLNGGGWSGWVPWPGSG
jgi:hypothetical protein